MRSACLSQNIEFSCENPARIHIIGIYYGRQINVRSDCTWESLDSIERLNEGIVRDMCDRQRMCTISANAMGSCIGNGSEYNLAEYRCIPPSNRFPRSNTSTFPINICVLGTCIGLAVK
jgi:hypothetical protein